MSFVRKIKVGERIYLAEVRSVRENGKVRQKFIRYVGTEINGQPTKRVFMQDIKVKNVKRSFDVLCIDSIAKELGITSIKNKYFLSLVYSQLLEKISISRIEDWLRFTEIPEVLEIKNVSTKELYESLTDIEDEEFEKIDLEMNHIFQKYDDSTDIAVIDVTDTYFEGDSEEIQRRKGKDGKVKKLLQVGLAVSFKNGFPLFHKRYQGNLSNIQIYKDMALELKGKGMHSVIIDRGMMSLENLQMTLNLQLKIIAGLKKTPTFASEYLSKINRDEIYSLKNIVQLKNTSVFINTFDYNSGKLIAVYNPSLEVMKKQFNFNKGISDVDKFIGYSLIYHNTDYTSMEIVKKYYDKEIIERAFKQMKGILSLRPIRVWLKGHVEGHIRICYLAYAILSLMNYKLRKLKVSAVGALNSLKHGYKVNLRNNKDNFEWSLYVPLEPKQKRILKVLGVVYKN
ncbi:transposase [Candidatus Kuenenbacteria bacterium]|nr:transposase [Candidatus Kuenenbacteria bacterium]